MNNREASELIFDWTLSAEFGDRPVVNDVDDIITAAASIAQKRYAGFDWQEDRMQEAVVAAMEAKDTFEPVEGKNGLLFQANWILSQSMISILRSSTAESEARTFMSCFSDMMGTRETDEDDMEYVERVLGPNAVFSPVSYNAYTDEGYDVTDCAFYVDGKYMPVTEVASRIAHSAIPEEVLEDFLLNDGNGIEEIEQIVLDRLTIWAREQTAIVNFVEPEPAPKEEYASYIRRGKLTKSGNIIWEKPIVALLTALETSARMIVEEGPLYAEDIEKEKEFLDWDYLNPQLFLERTKLAKLIAAEMLSGEEVNWVKYMGIIESAQMSPSCRREVVHNLAYAVQQHVIPHIAGSYYYVVASLGEDKDEYWYPEQDMIDDGVLRQRIINDVLAGIIHPDRSVSVIAKLDGFMPQQARAISNKAHSAIVRVQDILRHRWMPAMVENIIVERVYRYLNLDLPKNIIAIIGHIESDRIIKLIQYIPGTIGITGPGQAELAKLLNVPYIDPSNGRDDHWANGHALAIATHIVAVGKQYEREIKALAVPARII